MYFVMATVTQKSVNCAHDQLVHNNFIKPANMATIDNLYNCAALWESVINTIYTTRELLTGWLLVKWTKQHQVHNF